MNKKIYKGYELVKAIHDGEIEQGKSIEVYEYCPFMKDKKIATIKFVDNKLNWIAGEFDTSYLFNDYNYFMVLEDNTEEIEEKSNFENMGYEIAQAYFEFYKGIAKALTEKRKESEDKQ